MSSNRDEFTRATIEVLAKRVSYLCSNPTCRKQTIGANENENKATSIGIAAHITAASSGGARYDDTLTPELRKHIDNGIWLCSNCATLIDKDEKKFTQELLRKWKDEAEEESAKKLLGEPIKMEYGFPFLEVDLIWTSGGRFNRGYSNKNPVEMHEGIPVMVVGNQPIIFWGLLWNFNFVIFNNSNLPAYDLKIESIGVVHFNHLDKLPRINNLPPLKNLDLKANYEYTIEGDYLQADALIKKKIPEHFNDLVLELKYLDNARHAFTNIIEFKNGEIINNLKTY